MSLLDDAWQAALAAEHQAVFGYTLLGPRLTDADVQLALDSADEHRTVRDGVAAALARAGLTPVGPAADYPGLYPVVDAAAARRLAVRLEDSAAAAWRFLYARAAGGTGARAATLRGTAQTELTGSAVRALRWRRRIDPARATTAFPGI